MRTLFGLILAATSLVLFSLPALSEENAPHDHNGSSMEMTSPDQGRWATDTPLRQGMERIRNAVDARLAAFHQGQLVAAEVGQLADTIDENVSFMVANCKLEPEADATLHVLLGEILEGKRMLQQDPSDPQGMPRIIQALVKYPEYFEHHEWQPLETGHDQGP